MRVYFAVAIVLSAIGAYISVDKSGDMRADMLRTYTFDWCTPGSTDGTQVFKNRKIVGCTGNEKGNEYIADTRLQALCYVPARKCVSMLDKNTTVEQINEYNALAKFAQAKPGSFDLCTSQSSDGTILYERHLAGHTGKNGCTPEHTARSYNWVMNSGCVWLGRELVGCVDLPQSLSRENVVAMLNR